MALSITIAGIDLACADGGEGDPILIGEESRSFSGIQRSSVRTQKRTFAVTTVPVVQATWDSIQAAIANRAQVACSGIILSAGSFTASLKGSARAYPGSSPQLWVITLAGEQV